MAGDIHSDAEGSRFLKAGWKIREDLLIQPHDTGGWVLSDPVSLQFTLLTEREYRLLNRWVGASDSAADASAATDEMSAGHLTVFLNRMARLQIIHRPSGGDSERLIKTPRSTAWRFLNPVWWLGARFSIANPTAFLQAVIPRPGPGSYLACKWVAFVLYVLAIWIAFSQFDSLATESRRLFQDVSIGFLLVVAAIYVCVKLLHEFAHAAVAHWNGAQCHEVGIVMLFFVPVPFTNVTDSWQCSAKVRMQIASAGIAAELLVASLCLIIWSVVVDDVLSSLLLSTVLLCSFNTLLVNGNPLLKFDGYFVLSDWLGIPNLQAQAFATLRDWFRGAADFETPDRRTKLRLLIYGVLALFYRILLTVTLFLVWNRFSKINDLVVVGTLGNIVLIWSMLVRPLTSVATEWIASRQPVDDSAADPFVGAGKFSGSTLRLPLLGGLVLLLVLIPLPSSVSGIAIVRAPGERVYAPFSGFLSLKTSAEDPGVPTSELSGDLSRVVPLVSSHSTDDRRTDTGVVVSVRSPQYQSQILETEHTLATLEILQRVNRLQAASARIQSVGQLSEAIRAAEERLLSLKQRKSTGHIAVSPNFVWKRRPDQNIHSSQLNGWAGSLFQNASSDLWVEEGECLGAEGTEPISAVTAWVSESVIRELQVGQTAELKLASAMCDVVKAEVVSVGRNESPEAASEVQQAVRALRSGGHAVFNTGQRLFAVQLRLIRPVAVGDLPINAPATLRIAVRSRSLLSRLNEFFQRSF